MRKRNKTFHLILLTIGLLIAVLMIVYEIFFSPLAPNFRDVVFFLFIFLWCVYIIPFYTRGNIIRKVYMLKKKSALLREHLIASGFRLTKQKGKKTVLKGKGNFFDYKSVVFKEGTSGTEVLYSERYYDYISDFLPGSLMLEPETGINH